MQPPRYGYNRLETDEEVLTRLKSDTKIWAKFRPKFADETFDQWLDIHQETRKMIYVP